MRRGSIALTGKNVTSWFLVNGSEIFHEGHQMKPINLLCGILTFNLALSAHAQDPLTNGLVAYYPFNGNANDASGNGNNGVLHGTDWNYSFDRFGDANSLFLNTTSTITQFLDGAYVTAPRSSGLDFNKDFTLSVWVNLKSGTPLMFPENLISNGSDSTGGANLRVLLDWTDLGGIDILEFIWRTSGHIEHVIFALVLPRETWWQFAVVRSGTNVNLYMDGAFLVNGGMVSPVLNSSEIWLGRYETAPYPFFGGIDDVRMYNRALSPSEVQQLYMTESKCIPHAAKATARLDNGFVVEINITSRGCGYTNAPLVEIRGGGGSGATATASVSNGAVVGITVTDTGTGYTNTPDVVIASPPFMPSLGIEVSKVKVTLHVLLGHNYVVEASSDLRNWSEVVTKFTAHDELINQKFDVGITGRFFRIQEVP